MAESIKVPMELYMNTVPGLYIMGVARNPFTQLRFLLATFCEESGSIPSAMISTSRTVSAARKGEMLSGRSLGKKEMTLSVSLSLFSLTANPTAVEVKVLLAEYRVWRREDL